MMISETGKNKAGYYYHKNGFTLIELLCVIAIISMLFTISIPAISKTARNFYFTSKAKQIEYVLIYLKKTAVLEKRKYKLTIDINENSYTALSEAEDSAPDYELYEPVQDSLLAKKTLDPELKFKTNTDYQSKIEIIFEPKGSISAQEFYLYDQNQNTAGFKTTLSGQISMELI